MNVSSLAGKGASPLLEPYSASKFGLVGFTQALRSTYQNRHVGFSTVCPSGATDVGMYARMAEKGITVPPSVGTTTSDEVAQAIIQAIIHDDAETYVSSIPVQGWLVGVALFPKFNEYLTDHIGLRHFFERVASQARRRNARRRRTGVRRRGATTAMNRPLSVLERVFYHDRATPVNAVGLVRLDGPLPLSVVERAARRTQTRHPLLCARFADGPRLVTNPTPGPLSVECHSVSDEEDVQDWGGRELARAFPENGPARTRRPPRRRPVLRDASWRPTTRCFDGRSIVFFRARPADLG